MVPLMYNFVLAFLVLGVFFLVYLRKKDPSIVDVAFTVSLIAMSFCSYYLIDEKTSATHLFLFMSSLWGLRLFVLLVLRYRHGQKDLRYDLLKKSFKENQTKKFFFFFLFQAIASFFLSINFIVAYNYQLKTGALQIISFVLFLVFLSLEILADYQMFQFRKVHHGKQGVMNKGLWKYSRHPNYFFEIMVWCSLALFSSTTFPAIFSWTAVVMLLFFILKVTGIPVTEELLLQTKGKAYQSYQKTTSVFFPWFSKS